MTLDEFFAEAKRLGCRMHLDPEDQRAAFDAKDAEIERLRAALAQKAEPQDGFDTYNQNMVAWAVHRWSSEVANRPLVNIHRRTLDDTWRTVIRHCGGDPDKLLGPSHDALAFPAALEATK